MKAPDAVAQVRPLDPPRLPQVPPTAGAESLNTEYYIGNAEQERQAFTAFVRQIHEVQAAQARDNAQETQRGFHAKAHGCVTGWFQLFPDRDPRTRFGVFADGAGPWPVWIRYSNGVGWRQTDNELDARGMAVKLMGVPGPKLIDEEKATQDFLMTNSPTPVGRDGFDFMKFAQANASGKAAGVAFLVSHTKHGGPALLSTLPVSSAVAETYWSGGAFHLGSHQAVKFLAKPCSIAHQRNPQGSGENGLRDDLRAAAKEGFCFNFYLQFQTDAFRTPIEDASREWSEADSPPIPVGRIDVPSQSIDDEKRDAFCKQLSYSPWHGVAAHQPMGHINRARKYVYSASRDYRRGGVEPKDFSIPQENPPHHQQ
ncbi:MAG: catalase [Polyangiaceae bacterium]|nr:catalase [Polyangiaceae bacterium]